MIRPINVPPVDEPGLRFFRTVTHGFVVAEIEGTERGGWSVSIRAETSNGPIRVDDLGAMLQPLEALMFADRIAAIAREADRRNRTTVVERIANDVATAIARVP